MNFCFVSTRSGSHFMTELLAALATATEAAGHGAELVFDAFPPLDEDHRYVVVPHEFDAWGDPSGFPDAGQRARTIALCTENPGTEWFEATYRLVVGFAAAVSINRSSADELRRRGVRCEHLQLGYCARWDAWHRDESAARAIDVLYLGAADPRRDPLLAGIGAQLWARDCQFLIPPLEPRTGPRPDFLVDDEKYARLGQAKVLLNLHRTTSSALEWMRFLEAICNGCVVVSEPCLDGDPLAAGEHFLEVSVAEMAEVVAELLDDPDRLRQLRKRAYDFVRRDLPIEPAGVCLAQLGDELPRNPPGDAAPPRLGETIAREQACRARAEAAVVEHPVHLSTAEAPRPRYEHRLGALLRSARARIVPRRLASASALARTPAYERADPSVSVIAVVDDQAREPMELVDSVAASRCDGLELIVGLPAGDGRFDDFASLMDAHPDLPALLLWSDAVGLGARRNQLIERARGGRLLALPPAGGVFPSTIARLADALARDTQAAFAYPMVAVLDDGAPVALRGSLPWEPRRLTRGNWIDTPALIARDAVRRLGGYATDPRLHGLEDFDLWCRCAEAGNFGVHVPQVLGWHPPRDSAQPLDLGALPADARELLRERSPRLLADTAHE
jgi:hypothetical protein